MRGRMARSPSATAHAAAGLQQSEGKPWCSPRSLGDHGQDSCVDVPGKGLAAIAKQQGQFLVGVELEPQGQLHAVPQRLEQAVFVRRLSSSVKSAMGIGCGVRLPPKMLCLSRAK